MSEPKESPFPISTEAQTIEVLVSDNSAGTRGRARSIPVDELVQNTQEFLSRMAAILKEADARMGAFQLDEFEISAEVSAKGQLMLVAEAGITGGIKFVFRRAPSIEPPSTA